MALGRRRIYDRKRILEEAEQARSARRFRRAIALYRRVLAAEPRNADIHLRIAPMLARTGQRFDAWQSYDLAGRACLEAGQPDRARAVYREAARQMPRDYTVWRTLANLELRRQRPAEAREALLAGRARMRGRRRRPEAIALLRAARELAPDDVDTALDLARMLAGARQEAEARVLLARVADDTHGRALRRVRGLLWRLDPSLRNAWAWIRAVWDARHDKRVRVTRRARLASGRT